MSVQQQHQVLNRCRAKSTTSANTMIMILCSYFTQQVQARSGEINLCVQYEHNLQPIPNAKVTCHDEDIFFDDHLVTGYTDSNGCVSLSYVFDDDFFEWGPDIYCIISDGIGESMLTGVVDDYTNYTIDFGTLYRVTPEPTIAPTTLEDTPEPTPASIAGIAIAAIIVAGVCAFVCPKFYCNKPESSASDVVEEGCKWCYLCGLLNSIEVTS